MLTRLACAIQDCLTRNNYNEVKCQSAVQALYKCCDAMYAQAARDGKSMDEAKSTACPVKSVVDRKLKQWAREGQ